MMEELWAPVPGFDGYEVSTLGNVRSWRSCGQAVGKRRGTPRLLKPWPNKNGYLSVSLHAGTGERVAVRKVYRLVLEAFVGPCPDGHEGAHNDGVRSNNALSNLRWKTHAENEADKFAHGTTTRGSNNGFAKLSDAQVIAIRADPRSHSKVARDYGICFQQVSRIRRGERWAHL